MSQVVFLDDNEDLRTVMVSLIESRLTTSCLGLMSCEEMIENADVVLKSDVIILDLDLGYKKSSGIDAYKWLIDHGYQGSVHFLTGHGYTHPLMREASRSGVLIWEKPIGSTSMLVSIAQQIKSHESRIQESAGARL